MFSSRRNGTRTLRQSGWMLYVAMFLREREHADAEDYLSTQRLKENAKNLKLRPDNFETELRQLGFGLAQHLGTTGEGGESCMYDS